MSDQGLYQAFKSFLVKTVNEKEPDKVEKSTQVEESSTVIKKFKQQEQVSVEIIYEPEVLDAHGEWMSEDTIVKACANFNKNLESGNAKPNLFHLKSETEKLEILRTYVLPCECTIGETIVKKGTWVGEIKWHDDNLWKQRTVPNEDGVLTISGTSIGGVGVKVYPQESLND